MEAVEGVNNRLLGVFSYSQLLKTLPYEMDPIFLTHSECEIFKC